jgi:hypothetical protein
LGSGTWQQQHVRPDTFQEHLLHAHPGPEMACCWDLI